MPHSTSHTLRLTTCLEQRWTGLAIKHHATLSLQALTGDSVLSKLFNSETGCCSHGCFLVLAFCFLTNASQLPGIGISWGRGGTDVWSGDATPRWVQGACSTASCPPRKPPSIDKGGSVSLQKKRAFVKPPITPLARDAGVTGMYTSCAAGVEMTSVQVLSEL